MRTSDEIQKLITDIAISDDRIRAVILNGSRANANVVPDKYQDFDLVFIATEIESLHQTIAGQIFLAIYLSGNCPMRW